MLKNYLTIALRNILRNKVYTVVNISGLALGLCCCIVIYVIISYETSFDKFHPDRQRIYRIMGDVTESTGDKLHFARLPQPLVQASRNEVAGIDVLAGFIPYYAKITVPGNGSQAKNFDSHAAGGRFITSIIAEPQYFSIFKYTWLAGSAGKAMQAPNSVVLTESRARTYFNIALADEAIGKTVIYNDSLTTVVTGVVQDWAGNTDLGFTDFISSASLSTSFLKNNIVTTSWGQGDLSTWVFVKLSNNTQPEQVNRQLAGILKKYAGTTIKLKPWLEPINDMHFNADVIENPIRTAYMPVLYGMMGVGGFILLLGTINFINLSTAQFMRRSKETGIRKVMGSSRRGIMALFIVETFMLVLVAVIIAAALVKPVMAAFNAFLPEGAEFHFLQAKPILFLLCVTIVATALAGLYPARLLSAYNPVFTLKGAGATKGSEKWMLRKSLTAFQFAISLVFVISSLVITKQLNYTRNTYMGFNSDAILTVDAPRGGSADKVKVLAQKIKQLPGISNVALQWLPPMNENSRGMKLKFKGTDVKDFWVTQVAGDENYIPLYKVKLLAGRNLLPADTVREFVINESLLHIMGHSNPADAIGKTLYWNDKPYPVVGVAADFHTASLHDAITPLCIINRGDREGSIAVKLASQGKNADDVHDAIARLETAWKQVYPAATFNYKFYDETIAALYEKDRKTEKLVNTAMAVTIFISCIGLFGLALFTTQKRAKEISIRKVLGATAANITVMLTSDFALLIIIALLVASPVAWYGMSRWLQGFAYHTNISLWIFAIAGIIAIGIMLVTVSYHSIRCALANPIKNLRAE